MTRHRGWVLRGEGAEKNTNPESIDCLYMIESVRDGEKSGYIYFNSLKSKRQVEAIFPDAKVEAAPFNPTFNILQCYRRGGKVYEKGNAPIGGKRIREEEDLY